MALETVPVRRVVAFLAGAAVMPLMIGLDQMVGLGGTEGGVIMTGLALVVAGASVGLERYGRDPTVRDQVVAALTGVVGFLAAVGLFFLGLYAGGAGIDSPPSA